MLIADLDLPDGFGLELIRKTAAEHTDVDIMVLADSNNDPHVVSAIESGATVMSSKMKLKQVSYQPFVF